MLLLSKRHFDDPNDKERFHFQAITVLSVTVGLGNILIEDLGVR